ncbi:MAG: [LysW]-L-2-aminoadipate 6-phosphate reductase [Phycisphaerales bacterium]|nr:[LysW]-L-2-aminoadipate 6-phosphate reductase [Phycisphaerales bacterium]
MDPTRYTATIVGGSGYTGGELLRLLLDHPAFSVKQVTSRRQAGSFVHSVHPNLRGRTKLQFTTPEQVEPCDVLFLCMPHGEASSQIERWQSLAGRIVDLSADFRIKSPELHRRWYGGDHPAPAWCDRFVYGLPELQRDRLRGCKLASGVGCNATAVNLALLPLARAGLIESVVADLKVGSSEGGASSSASSHHPERSGAVRSFAPAGHRHQAEITEQLMTEANPFALHMSVTSIERVRGVLCTAHVTTRRPVEDKELWKLYREAYGAEPFVRLVKDKTGLHRYPDPKILSGSNYCDVGWEIEPGTRRVVVLSAIDNLMKGAAGSALQCANLMLGLEESTGLTFPGLHPA